MKARKSRARKTTTAPARVYNYGCSYRGIIANSELADQQYRLAHAYQQTLVELELKRRAAVRAILAATGDVAALQPEINALDADLTAAITAMKATKQASRSRVVAPEVRQRIADLRAKLKERRDHLKTVKRDAAADEATKAALDLLERNHRDEAKRIYNESTLFWGTKLIINRAVDQQRNSKHDPRQRPYTGEGRIAVQFQRGATVAAVFGEDTRMQLRATRDTSEEQTPSAESIAHAIDDLSSKEQAASARTPHTISKKRHMCKLRIGSGQSSRVANPAERDRFFAQGSAAGGQQWLLVSQTLWRGIVSPTR